MKDSHISLFFYKSFMQISKIKRVYFDSQYTHTYNTNDLSPNYTSLTLHIHSPTIIMVDEQSSPFGINTTDTKRSHLQEFAKKFLRYLDSQNNSENCSHPLLKKTGIVRKLSLSNYLFKKVERAWGDSNPRPTA